MSSLPGISSLLKVSAPPIVEPEQLHPVELFQQSRDRFGWTTAQFAEIFGCPLDTLYKWMQGRYTPNKWAKIYAANLKKQWERDWGL